MTRKAERAQTRYDDALRMLEESSRLSDEDREVINEFRDCLTREHLEKEGGSRAHLAVCLNELRLMGERTGCLAESLEAGEDGDRAFQSILEHQTDESLFAGSTICNRLEALKTFGDRLAEDGAGERFEKLDPASYRDKDPTPLRTNILDWHDVLYMAGTRPHTRDKALIMTQYSAGTRPESEMWILQFKHVEDKGDHIVLSVPNGGKTGRREVHIFAGAPMLRKWMQQDHPAHLESEDGPGPDTYLWTHLNRNKHMTYDSMYSIFKEAGEAAGIEKDHNPEHFRRSRASVLASRVDVNEQDLRIHFGWSWSSIKPKHYVAAFGGETGRHIALADGADVDVIEPPDPIAPITCGNCGERTTRHMDDCIWCAQEIPEEAEVRESVVEDPAAEGEDLFDLITNGDVTGDDVRSLRKLKPVIKAEPNKLDKLDELEKFAEGYHAAEDDSSDSVNVVAGPASLGAHLSAIVSKTGEKWARAKHHALKLHPDFEDYPPQGTLLAKVVGVQLLWTLAFIAMLYLNGSLGRLANGNLIEWTGAVGGLLLGMVLVSRAMPTPEEAVDARLNPE